ncbi:hypothetical protein DDA93_02210 [Arthrobacter sp. Bz4]|nr:hypothetical protein [Arthrobacter sp. CAL618]PVE19590.1 hypothetical protein DDA93_02210 [Arthrobacter sp. Bz4]
MDFSLDISASRLAACKMTPRRVPRSPARSTYGVVVGVSRYPVIGSVAGTNEEDQISASNGHLAATRCSHISIENESIL